MRVRILISREEGRPATAVAVTAEYDALFGAVNIAELFGLSNIIADEVVEVNENADHD